MYTIMFLSGACTLQGAKANKVSCYIIMSVAVSPSDV